LPDLQFPCEWKTTIFRKFSRQKKLEDKDAFSTPSKTKFTLLSTRLCVLIHSCTVMNIR